MYEDGTLPDEFFLARAGQKTCRHFRSFPEFRDLRRRTPPIPPPAPPPRTANRWLVLLVAIALALLLTALGSGVLHLIWGGN
jgi:hypothetical protein